MKRHILGLTAAMAASSLNTGEIVGKSVTKLPRLTGDEVSQINSVVVKTE